jgi:hypothetical protein
MDHNQMLVLGLANVTTILSVLIGILLNNGRLNDLTGYVRSLDARLTNLDSSTRASTCCSAKSLTSTTG